MALRPTEQQQYETCRRHGRDYFGALECDLCERERKSAAVVAFAARRRWERQANGEAPDDTDISFPIFPDGWEEETEPRHFDYPPDMRPMLLTICAFLVIGLILGMVVSFGNRQVDARLQQIEQGR